MYADYVSKQKLYSLQQIAKKLKIPQSTVAYYRNNYADFMPSIRLKGKRYPVYEQQAIEVVGLVRELSQKGKEQHEILHELETKYPPVIDKSGEINGIEQQTNEQPTAILATTQKQGEIISRLINQQTELIRSQDSTLEAYRKQLREKEQRIEELETELGSLRVAFLEKKTPKPPISSKRKKKPKKTGIKPSQKSKKTNNSKITVKKQQKKGFWGRVFG